MGLTMVARPVIALVGEFGEGEGSVGDNLERRGYEVRLAHSFWEVEALLGASDIDVAVVEVEGGAGSGIALLRRFGREDGPFFMLLSKRPDLVEKVLALELGAADVVESSVNARELAARIRGWSPAAAREAAISSCWKTRPSTSRRRWSCTAAAKRRHLSPGQVALLRLFLANPGKVLTRDDIMAAAPAESAEAFDRSIDSRIVRLRRKLETESIATIRGAGYRFDPPGNA